MPPCHFTCPGALVRPGKEPCPHQSRQPRRGSVSGQRSHCQKQEPWVSPLLCGSSLTRVSLFAGGHTLTLPKCPQLKRQRAEGNAAAVQMLPTSQLLPDVTTVAVEESASMSLNP